MTSSVCSRHWLFDQGTLCEHAIWNHRNGLYWHYSCVKDFFCCNHIPCFPNSCGQLSPHQRAYFSMEKQASSFLHTAHFFPHGAKKTRDLITHRAFDFLAMQPNSGSLVVSHGLFSINTGGCGLASGWTCSRYTPPTLLGYIVAHQITTSEQNLSPPIVWLIS